MYREMYFSKYMTCRSCWSWCMDLSYGTSTDFWMLVQTPNKIIYGDLGRHPMFSTSATRCPTRHVRPNMLLYLKDSGKKSKTCFVETAVEMYGCNKTFVIQTDLYRFINRDCWISSSKTGALVLLRENALSSIRFSNKVFRHWSR